MNIARGFHSLKEKHKQENTRKGDYKTHQVQSLLSFSWCNFTTPLGFTTHTTAMKWSVCMPNVPTAVYFESTSTLNQLFPYAKACTIVVSSSVRKECFFQNIRYSIHRMQQFFDINIYKYFCYFIQDSLLILINLFHICIFCLVILL